MTIQNRPSETSEMSCSNEYVALSLNNKDTTSTMPCDTVFEESSSLMMKSSSHDNVSDDMLSVCSSDLLLITFYIIIMSLPV